ncbi:MAG: holo-ACP synthase [Nannocystaceae bacterium]|nr:holo-ACP synthase [Myxococcales bacterium]
MLIAVGHDLQLVAELAGRDDLREPGLVFTAAECARIDQSADPLRSLAGAFAAKEALFKALPALDGAFWTDMELVHDRRGAPSLRLHGVLAERFASAGWRALLSISHSGDYASAIVIVDGEAPTERAPA